MRRAKTARERKRAQASLQLFRMLIDQSNDAIEVIDPETLRFLDANGKACSALGYSREELLSLRVFDIDPTADQSWLPRLTDDLRKSGFAIMQSYHRRKDGSTFPVEVNMKYVQLDRDYVVAVARDITERKRAEEALRESEDRYRDLVEHSHDLVCTHDLQGKLLSANPAPARILGYEVAELLKIPMRELVAPEYREQFDQYLDRIKSKGADQGLLAVVTRTGERRFWEYHNSLRTEGVPTPIVRGMAQDVTERKVAERELRAGEERFRQLAESIHEVFYLEEAQRPRLLYVSPAYEEVWGRSCQSAYEDPTSFLDAIHPDDREMVRQAYVSRVPFAHEYRVIRPDGSVRWILDRGFPIHDKKGQVYRFAGIAEDITERKLAENELRRSEACLAEAQRLSHTGSWSFNVSTGEVVWSQEIFRIFGLDPVKTKLTRDRFFQSLHPEDRPLLEGAEKKLREGQDIEHEYRILRPDGSMRFIHAQSHPVVNRSGEAVEFVGVLMDVTERKRAERALQESQAELARVTRSVALGELAASIAHEIKQPLSAIVISASASLHWLTMQPPNLEEAREAATRAVREANRASEIIERIRALLQKAPAQMMPLDVNEIIRAVVSLASSELTTGDVSMQTELAADIPVVLGDRIQLQQVMLNLVMNAIDAMSMITDRPRELFIKSAKDQDGVLIQVQDSGKGLDPEHAGRIFEPFFTTKPQGIGMGLSISRSIIESHGGRLWARPGPAHGAIFELTLPEAESAHGRAA